MDRKDSIKGLSAIAVAPIINRRRKRVGPNILVIMTDDQTAPSTRAMPAVTTRLCVNGVRFPHAFTATPICGPARGSMLTGKYSHNTGVTDTARAYEQMQQNNFAPTTIAKRLRDAGYRTGLFGKYQNGYEASTVPIGWDRWFAMLEPFNRGETYWFNSNGETREYSRDADNETDVIANNADAFIRNDDRPWFAYVCPHEPHGPYFPAPRHADAFKGETWDPASEGEADLSDKPQQIREEPAYSDVEEAQNERNYRGKLRELASVDDMVDRLLDTLRDRGQLDNTLIIYLSDNGELFGEHRLDRKNLPYDEAARVPFIVRGPGVQRGVVGNALVSQVDLAPTIADVAGVPRVGMDGRSLLPLLRGETPEWRRSLYIENIVEGWFSLRTPTHWYTEWDDGSVELYDLRSDPDQMRSVHRDSENDAIMFDLSATLRQMRHAQGVELRALEG